jgi:hypothetical protein
MTTRLHFNPGAPPGWLAVPSALVSSVSERRAYDAGRSVCREVKDQVGISSAPLRPGIEVADVTLGLAGKGSGTDHFVQIGFVEAAN